MRSIFALCLCAGLLAACSSVPRKEALELATSGKDLTAAGAQNLTKVARDVAAIPERHLVRGAVTQCQARLDAAAPAARAAVRCDPPALPPDDVTAVNEKLSRLILARAKMLTALGEAYGALAAEAEYDARADLEGAVNGLLAPGKALNSAAAAVGLSPLPGLDLIVPIAARVAGLRAESAQKQRLVQASRSIRGAATATRSALAGEAQLYGRIAGQVEANRVQLVDMMLESGLADPKPATQSFLTDLDLALSGGVPASDQRLIVASRALSRHRAAAISRARTLGYAKQVEAFDELIAAHEAFEADQLRPRPDLDRTIEELGFWTDVLGKLQTAPEDDAK